MSYAPIYPMARGQAPSPQIWRPGCGPNQIQRENPLLVVRHSKVIFQRRFPIWVKQITPGPSLSDEVKLSGGIPRNALSLPDQTYQVAQERNTFIEVPSIYRLSLQSLKILPD
jgi:hypothetical protein